MNTATEVFLLALATLAANLPFLTERVLFVRPPRGGRKRISWRLVELAAGYLAVGAVARTLEARAGAVYPQNWEFYVVTVCLFLVLAFPGFVYRYLWKHHG